MRMMLLIVIVALQTGSVAPTFEDFPVADRFRGTPAAPVLSTPAARMFRTELRRQAATGPNFSGHFTVARWGCGAACAVVSIIDARNGQVWTPLLKVEVALGPDGRISLDNGVGFEIDSDLIIAAGKIDEREVGTAYYRWRDGRLQRIHFEPHRPGR